MDVCMCILSCVILFVTPWTVACQAPLSKAFPEQESWSGLSFPSPGDLPDPGIEPCLLHCRWIPCCCNTWEVVRVDVDAGKCGRGG